MFLPKPIKTRNQYFWKVWGGIITTITDTRKVDPKLLNALIEQMRGRYLASDHFRFFLLRTIPEVAETYDAENLQIVTPTGSEILLQDGVSTYMGRPATTLWDLIHKTDTWALYEPSHEDKRSCAGYCRLEKPNSRLLALVADGMQIPPGSLQHAQPTKSGQVNLENSLVLARLGLVSPNVEAINRVAEQYNRLQPNLWHTH